MVYKVAGKVVETKVGRQYADDMTASRASNIRGELIDGKRLTRQQERNKAKEEASKIHWTIDALWNEYKKRNQNLKGIATDQSRFNIHLAPFHKLEPQ